MTTPDPRSVLDLIADVQAAHDFYRPVGNPARPTGWLCRCGVETHSEPGRLMHRAAAVLAACQGATVEQQAELVKGWVRTGRITAPYGRATVSKQVRVVGPWREDPS